MKATIVVAALTGIAMLSFTDSVQAQYKAVSDDGIAASPKLRERLNEYNRSQSPAPAPVEIPQMPCPRCKDTVTQCVDYAARGANKPVIRVAKPRISRGATRQRAAQWPPKAWNERTRRTRISSLRRSRNGCRCEAPLDLLAVVCDLMGDLTLNSAVPTRSSI